MNRPMTALLMLLLTAVPWPATPADVVGLSYEELLARLGEVHPEYLAMQGEISAARSAVDVARAFPDPLLKVELMDIDLSEPEFLPGQAGGSKYTYEQMFPLWGKRGLKTDVAAAGVRVAQARAELTLAELRAMLRVAFAEFFAAHQSQAINDEVLALLRELEQSVKTRYANGLAAQQDVIKVKVEQTMLTAEQEMLRGESRRAQVVINSLIGQPTDAPLPAPSQLPDTRSFTQVCQSLQHTLAAQTPALALADAAVQGRLAANELATRERYPDLTLGISPTQVGDRLDAWEFMFSVNLPLFGGRRALQAESSAMLASARDRREAEIRRILSATGQALADYEAARNQQQLFEQQLLAETELNFRAALASYQTSAVDFDTVIEAEQQIRKVRLLTLAAALRQQRAVAQFEQSTGLQP